MTTANVIKYTDRDTWLAAVKAAGLVILDLPCTQHEGPHEDDLYEPEWAVSPPTVTRDRNAPGGRYFDYREYGVGQWIDHEHGMWEGYLAATPGEWGEYMAQCASECGAAITGAQA